jgi:hypothetical protein
MIIINPDKAKVIWKDRWREVRKPLLASLDIEFIKAVETADTTKQAEIASKKQALRDVTQTEIVGNTPEEIKAVWPDVLKEAIAKIETLESKVTALEVEPVAPEVVPTPEPELVSVPELTPVIDTEATKMEDT